MAPLLVFALAATRPARIGAQTGKDTTGLVKPQLSGASYAQTHCEQVRAYALAHATVVRAEWLSPSSEQVNDAQHTVPLTGQLQAHCAVEVVSTPVADSSIHITIWLPAADTWNGSMLATGNGGYSSQLSIPDMADGLRRGYVVGGSDTGHTGDQLSFGAEHPEKIRDWAYRATHELALAEKSIVTGFYGKAPAHAFFRGCSTGGQQGLSEAQRYPEDFDGIVAGDPGNDRIRLNADFVTSWVAAHPVGTPPFSRAKLPMLAQAVMQACDRNDGVADGIIGDPRTCHFDPGVLACKAGQQVDNCLTAAEVNTVRSLYAGTVRTAAGKPLYFGWPRGSELGWGAYIVDPPVPVRQEFWKAWVYSGATFDPQRFEPAMAIADAQHVVPYTEAMSPDLNAFVRRGGKLLMYHGWADAVVPPEDTVAYLEAVEKLTPGKGVRLFMVPGMGHCGGGPGATVFDALGTLEAWVRTGVAPEVMTARKVSGDHILMERPLCSYPDVASWDRRGDTTKAASFECRPPAPEVSAKP